MPPYFSSDFSLNCLQSIDCGSILFVDTSSCSFFFVPVSLFDFCLLQIQCASCRFAMSDGCPPLSIGIIWSIQGLSGAGYFRFLSTGYPHIPQQSCDASILFLFRSNARRCVPSWSGRFLFCGIFPSLPSFLLYTLSHLKVLFRAFVCFFVLSFVFYLLQRPSVDVLCPAFRVAHLVRHFAPALLDVPVYVV